jgi:hypothetical protein
MFSKKVAVTYAKIVSFKKLLIFSFFLLGGVGL